MKRLFLITVFLMTLAVGILDAQTFNWAEAGSGEWYDIAYDIALDAAGNHYVVGKFNSPVLTFGTTTLTNVRNGYHDLAVVKYGMNGDVAWARSAGGTFNELGQSVAIDDSGDVYVVGSFDSPTVGVGSTTLTSNGLNDILLAKYDRDGNVLWATSAGGTNRDYGLDVAVDHSGNSYVAGSIQSDSFFYGSTFLTSRGGQDLVLAKYDKDGNILWVMNGGGAGADDAVSVAVDMSGNCYLAGRYLSDTTVIGTDTLRNTGGSDMYLAKFDPDGNIVWTKSSRGRSNEEPAGIAIDMNGNCYATGRYNSDTTTFGGIRLPRPRIYDMFLVKYNPAGTVLWAKGAGGETSDGASKVAVNSAGDVCVTGNFTSSVMPFGTDTLRAMLTDMYIADYDTAGNVLWARGAGGTSNDYVGGLAVDEARNGYIAGGFESLTIQFAGDTLSNQGTLAQTADMFIARMSFTTPDDVSTTPGVIPAAYQLYQNYPNPFNPSTEIVFDIPASSNVTVKVFDVLGQEVAVLLDERMDMGKHTIQWNAAGLPSGVYLYRIQAGAFTETMKMMLMK